MAEISASGELLKMCVSHVSLGTNDFAKAVDFYDAVLATIGVKRMVEYPTAVCYGREFPEFWLHPPLDGSPATVANGVHVGFTASSRQAVHAFWDKAIALGATADGEPGPRPLYGEPYYGCFVRDLDGHKIEAVYWDMGKAPCSSTTGD